MSRNIGYGCSCVWVALLVLVLAVKASGGDTICSDAIKTLLPCKSFLDTTDYKMTFPCCAAAAAVDKLIGSDLAKLKTACNCLKQAAVEMKVDKYRAKQINLLCEINVIFLLNPNIDCDSL